VTLRGLIVDWGGVLTTGLHDSMSAWAAADGIDYDRFGEVMRDWLGPQAGLEATFNPVHALERGEMEVPDFERHLTERLTAATGSAPAAGMVERMFARFEHAHDMRGLVHRAHTQGLRTALLSNSWGNSYPRDGWAEMFDAVVISGEVGMRKPEQRIYQHTADLLGVTPQECVFVDDLPVNVAAAVASGMVGIHHTDYERTAAEVEILFDLPLRD
jgi:putative hydrolase of the HAD superfamily